LPFFAKIDDGPLLKKSRLRAKKLFRICSVLKIKNIGYFKYTKINL